MTDTIPKTYELQRIRPERLYSSSILRLARHLWKADESIHVLALADALQKRPDVLVVGVVDGDGRPVGVVGRDRLFALIGKPFGREVLRRSAIAEIAEAARSFRAHADLFAVAQELRGRERATDRDVDRPETKRGTAYHPLVDDDGRLQGIFAEQDLADYLARITQDDIELAGRLQERLLAAAQFPDSPGYRLEAWSRSARGVGGDFYFAREIPGNRTFATLCDVSGKGVAASLIVAMVWGILRAFDFRRGLRDLLVSLNKAIVATFRLEKYLTGFFMIYDGEAKRVTYADMGHSHVFLIRGGRAHAVRSDRMNLPIGIESGHEPVLHAIGLRDGDVLFAYSDGIVEQENGEGTVFGDERLTRMLIAYGRGRGRGTAPLSETLPAAMDGFRGGTPQQDDMSFLLLEIGEPSAGQGDATRRGISA